MLFIESYKCKKLDFFWLNPIVMLGYNLTSYSYKKINFGNRI